MSKVVAAVVFGLFFAFTAHAQDTAALRSQAEETARREHLPYRKYTKLPAFNIMLTDSTTIFNTFNIPAGRPIALMMFDPDCKHCKALTKELVAAMDSIENIDFYLMTPAHDMSSIRRFYNDFHLSKFKNIKVIGRDYEFFFHDFYGVRFVPDIALYDKNKELIKLFEANATVKDLYEYTHSDGQK